MLRLFEDSHGVYLAFNECWPFADTRAGPDEGRKRPESRHDKSGSKSGSKSPQHGGWGGWLPPRHGLSLSRTLSLTRTHTPQHSSLWSPCARKGRQMPPGRRAAAWCRSTLLSPSLLSQMASLPPQLCFVTAVTCVSCYILVREHILVLLVSQARW